MIVFDDISLQRGGRPLLESVSVRLPAGGRIGFIGANGAGKSSVFKLLLGELESEQGRISWPRDWRVASLAQEVEASTRPAVDYVIDGHHALRRTEAALREAEQNDAHEHAAELHGQLEALDAYRARSQAETLLAGLGFNEAEFSQPMASFSGGWRIRLNLAQTLMNPSDLLLLDEPTNHLDLDAVIWLEGWLKRYQGTLMIIAHDREFLDGVADHIVHLEHHDMVLYAGNYSAFERQRSERLALVQAEYEKQQKRVQEIQQFIDRFKAKASRARQAQSRVKQLEKMTLIAPAHVDSPFYFRFSTADKMSRPLRSLENADLGYGEHVVLRDVSLTLMPQTRVGLLGRNGAGKSTLVKTIAGELRLLGGKDSSGANLVTGYFDQHQVDALDGDATPLLTLKRMDPDVSEQRARNFLGGFGFDGDRVKSPVGMFSGGEKARLALALIIWGKPNLLLLDEPTNHLDIEMREALTHALQTYEGALMVVSHDRHLLANTVDEFHLVSDGTIAPFFGDLMDYQDWLLKPAEKTPSGNGDSPGSDRKTARRQRAAQRQKHAALRKDVKRLESGIERLSQRLREIEQSLSDQDLYQSEQRKTELNDLLAEQVKLVRELSDSEEHWLEASERLETSVSES